MKYQRSEGFLLYVFDGNERNENEKEKREKAFSTYQISSSIFVKSIIPGQ